MSAISTTQGTMTERDLLTRQMALAGAGDRRAFRAVYDGTKARIYALLCRILRDEAMAGDVMQEVYLSVWQRRATFNPDFGLSPTAWLTAIARNRAIDRLRAVARAPGEIDIGGLDLVADDVSALERLERGEQQARLSQCLQYLASHQQSAIRAAFFDGATYVELAHRANVPIGTMKSWIRRGLLQLKDCMSS
ncbi:MAG: sigma-70 family RNA polymerase sigma factor [Sandarakinorhabdus sp.]